MLSLEDDPGVRATTQQGVQLLRAGNTEPRRLPVPVACPGHNALLVTQACPLPSTLAAAIWVWVLCRWALPPRFGPSRTELH